MTAGQIATPYRQIRAPLLVAALAVTFGLGTLAGLAVPRTVGQAAEAASNAAAAPATTTIGTWADRAALLRTNMDPERQSANAAAAPASTSSGTSAGVPSRLLRTNMDPELRAAEIGGGGLDINQAPSSVGVVSVSSNTSLSAGVPNRFSPR